LVFTDHWQKQSLEDQYKRLGQMLGVYWNIQDVASMMGSGTGKKTKQPTEAWFPLTLIMQPQMEKMVKNFFGTSAPPKWTRGEGEEVVQCEELDQEKFKQIAGMFTHLLPGK
jgi:hypothetical protein